MTVTADELARLREPGTTREQLLRALANAVADLREDHPTVVELWTMVEECTPRISSSEFAGHLNNDPRIDPVHPTTWNYRKNKALGKPNWRDQHPSVQRRRKPEGDNTEAQAS